MAKKSTATVEEIKEVIVEEPAEVKTASIIDCEKLNLRKGANLDATVLKVLDSSSSIEVIEDKGDWTKVKADGKIGYVMSKYIFVK